MLDVLIADDEKLIRKGLPTIIDWEAEGFRICGTASDGLECMDLLRSLRPDVCIIDIRMPGRTGLEVIELCRKEKIDVRFIILSGYRDFEYARKAINYNVDNYLLKPIDEEELTESLTRIKSLKSVKKSGTAADYEVFSRLLGLSGEKKDGTDDPGWESYQILLLDIPGGISSALTGFLESNDIGILLRGREYAVIILQKHFIREPGLLALNSLFSGFSGEHDIICDGVLSREVKNPDELEKLYRETLKLMSKRFLSSRPGITAEFDFPETEKNSNISPDMSEHQLRLEQMVEIAGDSQIQKTLNEISRELTAAEFSTAQIREWYSRLCTGTLESVISKHKLQQMSSFSHSDLDFSIRQCRRISELEELVLKMIFRIIDRQDLFSGETLVKKMKFLIASHYQENLRIRDLSDTLNYNSAYLGKVFKAHEGVSFNTYLDQIRIDKAKELLRQGYKVYQTAENVGYAYVDYFHTKFRKYVGMSPLEYRKKILDEGQP